MMSQKQINDTLVAMTKSFYVFSEQVARGLVEDIAPPFLDYQSWDGDIISYCSSFFERYNAHLKALDVNHIHAAEQMVQALVKKESGKTVSFDLLKEVHAVETMISEAIVQSFKGFPSEAFLEFEKTMIDKESHLLNLLPQIEIENATYFRVRKKGKKRMIEAKDLFHVPFELRGKCATYRYSVPGYPSLYLSHRLKIACLETDISRCDSYYSSCFKAASPHGWRFIDLSLPSNFETVWDRYSFLVFYPLIMACGLKVKSPRDAFKPEYIIPQLLAQVVRLHMIDSCFDGISYTCTKVNHPDFMDINQRNFVLWITGAEQENGYSKELSKKVLSTPPLRCYPWNSADKIEYKLRKRHFDKVLED